ncbi:MAG: tetratricopeptide repeat protein [Flavobacteriales bacterium]|nr:tetratricopeptide repeat protein [Flavobacteriales bacterium]
MKTAIALFFTLALPLISAAQMEKLQLDKGNKAYRDSAFDKAMEDYDAALERDGDLAAARFNRANAMVRRSAKMAAEAAKMEDDSLRTAAIEAAASMTKKAASDFESIAKLSQTDEDRNKARFNQGNAHLLGGEIDESIKAYKEALRIDPKDEAARYNLAYAQSLKQKQEEQQQEQDQEQDQDQDQDQDGEQQEQDEQNQDNQNNDQNQDQQEQQQPDQLTQEEAEKMLEAMMQREKDLQEQVDKKRHKATRSNIEKDW